MKKTILFAALLALAPAAAPAFAAAAEAPAKAPEYTDEQQALLKALDAEIARFEAMLAKDDDAAHAATVKEFIAGFKARRDTMNKLPFDRFPIGSRLRVLPNHVCMTAAMYGRYYVTEGGTEVVDEWDRVNGW